MGLNYNNIMKVIQNIEEEVLFDVESPAHWYEIKFNNDELIIYEIDEYDFDGDEWGTIETKTNTTEIERFKCSLIDIGSLITMALSIICANDSAKESIFLAT